MLEAECTRCKGIFVPHGTEPDDLIHGVTEADEDCGGIGVILGVWVVEGTPEETNRKFDSVAKQERHGMDHPHCADPDCEFHHPEVRES